MSDEDQTEDISQEELLDILKDLKLQHRRIDTEIAANQETGVIDVLKIQRMKKIKLSLKDKIAFIKIKSRQILLPKPLTRLR